MIRESIRNISPWYFGGTPTVNYDYDSRDRCTQVRHQSATLAQYLWLGQAVHRRDTTCDYPGSTKPKFRADYQRDGLMRMTRLTHTHQTLDQADSGYNDLGSWDYTYDAASNLLTAGQTGGMGHLDADRVWGLIERATMRAACAIVSSLWFDRVRAARGLKCAGLWNGCLRHRSCALDLHCRICTDPIPERDARE